MCHSRFFWVLAALVSSACGGSTFDNATGTVGGSAGTSGDVGTGGLGQGGLNGTGGGAPSGGTLGAGGLASTGGLLGTGGAAQTGGRAGMGGAAQTGGTFGTGGAAYKGGTSSTGGTAQTGGALGTGGTVSVDPRCPPKTPTTVSCDANGLSCTYNYFSGCLCYTGAPYTCTQVDPACVLATTASPSNAIPNTSLGGAAGIVAPLNRVCTCSGGTWVCSA